MSVVVCRSDASEMAISAPPRSTSRNVGLPVRTVRARSNSLRMWRGQAVYLRSGTRNTMSTYSAGSPSSARIAATRSFEHRLVPIDLLRQVGDHGDLAVVEADGAGVLALRAAAGGGTVAVAKARWRRRASRRGGGRLAPSSASSCSRASIGRRQRGDLADRHGSDVPELGTVGRGVHYAASSVMVWVAKSGSAPLARGRAMAK